MPRRASIPGEIYQLKVTLRDLQPPIWRRIQVRSEITLARLHKILQRVMGWEDAHLHQFVIRGERYGPPGEADLGPAGTKDERKYRLNELVAGERAEFAYTYDFGDDWQHALVLEKILPSTEGVKYPLCVAGARACPPEDVGGIPGYENFLEAMKDPTHSERKDYLEWIGGEFDPEAFDLDVVNQLLQAMR